MTASPTDPEGAPRDPQERVRLGATDIEVSALGVGAWAWGDSLTWGYGRGYGRAEVEGAFRASLEAGIDFIDTAEIYGMGRSERLLGEFLQSRGDGVVVATKFFPYPWRLTQGDVRRALRGSLRRLGQVRVDLYQIHGPFSPVPPQVWMKPLAVVVREGLARAVGVSNYGVRLTEASHRQLADLGAPLASNQIEFSLLERAPERTGLMDLCRRLGVTVIAYSPLAMGLLTGKFSASRPLPLARRRAYWGIDMHRLGRLIEVLREVGQAHAGKTPGQVALNWVLCKGALPIPGAKNAAQASENAGALGWRLTADEVSHLEKIADAVVGR